MSLLFIFFEGVPPAFPLDSTGFTRFAGFIGKIAWSKKTKGLAEAQNYFVARRNIFVSINHFFGGTRYF
jgi:hypothetical protein